MPKEVIRGGIVDGQHVTVGWTPDQEVQIGVGLGSSFYFESDVPNDGMSGFAHTDLWFTATDRRQVNDLIRNLRRARDSAFGVDA